MTLQLNCSAGLRGASEHMPKRDAERTYAIENDVNAFLNKARANNLGAKETGESRQFIDETLVHVAGHSIGCRPPLVEQQDSGQSNLDRNGPLLLEPYAVSYAADERRAFTETNGDGCQEDPGLGSANGLVAFQISLLTTHSWAYAKPMDLMFQINTATPFVQVGGPAPEDGMNTDEFVF